MPISYLMILIGDPSGQNPCSGDYATHTRVSPSGGLDYYSNHQIVSKKTSVKERGKPASPIVCTGINICPTIKQCLHNRF